MEAPPVREGAFSPEAAYYIDKLARKEEECNEILAQFNKYKVKTKVRFDQLRHEISNILHERDVDPEDERHQPAMLLVSLNETQFRLEEAEKVSEALRADVEQQQLHINDQIILIKNLEDQLREWEEGEYSRERRRNEPVDMEKVQQQMMYKDERIVELNSLILDKERQILDLQDACRSASEVATSKKEAMRIVQKKFDEMERRSRREMSTETDERVTGVSFDGSIHAADNTERIQPHPVPQVQLPQPQRSTRTSSPGRAVHVVNKNGCNSPPPLDPSELDDQPGTSKLAKTKVDGDSNMREKKQRKRVTFDLPQAASREDISRLTAVADSDEITDALLTLTADNERLRAEMERIERMEKETEEMAIRLAQAESAVTEAEREARHASLKARAVAQARIKELEDRMASQNALSGEQIDRLQVETETLRSTRDWEVEQNARMREQLAHTKEKLRQLREELDASVQWNRAGEKKLDEKEELMVNLVSELEDAESLAVFLEDQKHQILDDVDKLRDAMQLYEEYIELLEADIVIYETRVGNLREELGVSKMNQRDHIKSKAFNTKLQMINKEKEQIDRKANDERLRTKALHAKVQILEAENEKLMARLCEAEMAGEDTWNIDAACKELQAKMEETESETSRARADYESRLKAAEFATESFREECDRLRTERDAVQQHSAMMQQQQQTQLHIQQQPGCSMQLHNDSSSSVETALRLAQSAQESLTRERDELADRVHVLGGENFELTKRTEDAEREMERLESRLREVESRLRESSERELNAENEKMRREERRVEREEELIELRGRVAERDTTVERMDSELKRLRSELDHAHLAMAESAAVKREVMQLQQQMELEREAAATKWQQVAMQLKSYEELASNSGWDSRKTSVDESATAAAAAAAAELRATRAEAETAAVRNELRELQQMNVQSSTQLQQVQHEIPRRVAAIEEEETMDRHEMDVMRSRIEELESEVELSHELNVESGRTVKELQKRLEKIEHERRLLENLTVEFSADLAEMREEKEESSGAAAVNVQPVEDGEEIGEMRRRLEELEEEAIVSEELHVEMGRTVQVLEGRIREMEMERRLHELMNVELTTQLQELRQQPHPAADAATVEAAANAEEIAAAAAERDAALQEQLENERRQRTREQEAAREELQRLQMALYAAEDAKREVTRRLKEKEETESLVRATAATFDVVAVAAGPSNSNNDQVPKIIFPESAAGAAAVAAEEEEEEKAALVQENALLREAVYQNVRHQESVTNDVTRLLELKEELEKAVEALRGEIWSLNGQLKASVLDRENLQDRVVELDTKVALEKRRADLLDVELAEQVELRENAQRQAAEAENESNRRLAECAEMDCKREDLEKAYGLLAGYYSQLQEAYNVLYAQQQHQMVQQEQLVQQKNRESGDREDRSTQTESTVDPSTSPISVQSNAAAVAVAAPVAVPPPPPPPPSSSSSRRAMAEVYSSRLASLRELSVQLTKSVLATELATLESELDNSITSIEGLSGTCPEAGANVDALLDAIIQDYDGSSGVSPDERAKIASVHSMLRAKISEVERVHCALREQRGVCGALEERLTELEAVGPPHGVAGPSSPGTASSIGHSELEERIEECEALRAHVEQLQEIISRYVSREEAARLATREADVDSLFKTNAELAHENVRLQNEIDEKGEERRKEKRELSTSSTQTHNEQSFNEAELELVKEELEEEREARKRAEKRRDEMEHEMRVQQGELEETIVDLTVQLQNNSSAASVGQPEEREAEREEREEKERVTQLELSTLKEDLGKERTSREKVEKELKKMKEDMEDMKNERQLIEADKSEANEKMEEMKRKKNEIEKKLNEMKKEKEEMNEKLMEMEMKEEEKGKEEEKSGWDDEEWGEEEEEEKKEDSSQEIEKLQEELKNEKERREIVEERMKEMENEKKKMEEEMEKREEKKEEEKGVKKEKNEKNDDGWGEDWDEEMEEEETAPVDASNEEMTELKTKLEWERSVREEAETELKNVEEEKGRMVQQLQQLQQEREEEKEQMEMHLHQLQHEGERLVEQLREEKEEKERMMQVREEEEKGERSGVEKKKGEKKKKKKKKKESGWSEEEWEDEKDEKNLTVDELRRKLKAETEVRMNAEGKRDLLFTRIREMKKKEDERPKTDWEKEVERLNKELKEERDEKDETKRMLGHAETLLEEMNEELMLRRREMDEGTMDYAQSRRMRDENKELKERMREMETSHIYRVSELESDNGRVRNTMVQYEHIMNNFEEKVEWLERKIEAIEKGEEVPPPPREFDDSDRRWNGDGRRKGKKAEKRETRKEQLKVFEIIDNPEDQPNEEEVEYNRDYFVPDDADDVSELFLILNGFREEAANLQDESRRGGVPAQQKERMKLRKIVKSMADKLQELEDNYFNDNGHLKETIRMRDEELKETWAQLRTAWNEMKDVKEEMEKREKGGEGKGENKEEEQEEIKKLKDEMIRLKEEIERLRKQNNLLKESEAKLTECVDTSNGRIEETEKTMERLRRQLESSNCSEEEKKLNEAIEKLTKKIEQLEGNVNAKESELAIERREKEEEREAKIAAEGKLSKMMEAAKKRRETAAARGNAAGPAPSSRSYVGGSRRTSTASSIWNEETQEKMETNEEPSTVRVDRGMMDEQVLLETYRGSLRDLLHRVTQYLEEAERRDRNTGVTIDYLQLNIEHVTDQLEMGKKKGARGKRTSASQPSSATDADSSTATRTEESVAPSENASVVTRESMTESMEDDYITAALDSTASSASIELMEEQRHNLIERTSHAHSCPAPSSPAHTDNTQDGREMEERMGAGGEDETQEEEEEEEEEEGEERENEIGERITKDLNATRENLSSLREDLTSFVKDMGGWMQHVQQLQQLQHGEEGEEKRQKKEMERLENQIERDQVEIEVMETELERANETIWQLQQTAKTAATAAIKMEERLTAAEKAANAAQDELQLQQEEEEEGRSRHERERNRLIEETVELQRMLAAADAAAAAATIEAAASREATRNAKRERDEIERELSALIEEGEEKMEKMEQNVRAMKEEVERAEERLMQANIELEDRRREAALQTEKLQQKDERREEQEKIEMEKMMEEKERVKMQLQQLQQEMSVKEDEVVKREEMMKEKLHQLEKEVSTARQVAASAAELEKTIDTLNKQLKDQVSVHESTVAISSAHLQTTEELRGKLEESEAALEKIAEEMKEITNENKMRQEREIEAANDEKEEIEELKKQLENMKNEKEEEGIEFERREKEMEEKIRKYVHDIEETAAAANKLQQAIITLEQQVQQARVDKEAAAAANEESKRQAGKVKDLEEEVQQLQLQQSAAMRMEEGMKNDLEKDIVRMEVELTRAHERIERAEGSAMEQSERAANLESAATAARQEAAILRSEMDRMSMEQLQMLQGSDERMAADEKVKELERESEEKEARMRQMSNDLDAAEDRAAAAVGRAAVAAEKTETMENTVSDLQSRLDNALGEIENMRRSIGEVQNLEAALKEAHDAQSKLAAEIIAANEDKRVMGEEKEASLARLSQLTEQLSQRTDQAIRASEERNRSMTRMIEMEQRMEAAAAAVAASAADEMQLHENCAASVVPTNATRRVSFDLTANECATSDAVVIEMPAVDESEKEEEEEERIMDELLPRSGLLFASTPSPSLLQQLQSWLRRQTRQSRALRPNRALMPYARYAGAVYVVFLQLAVIHCWFF